LAASVVAEWEEEGGQKASNPQMEVGARIGARLDQLNAERAATE
jgi:hypothetical protein